MIALDDVMKGLSGIDYQLSEENAVVYGHAQIASQAFHIIGVKESTFLGAQQALIMAEKVIAILESQSPDPLLLLVDVAGQQLIMRDEWLGMHQYFAHLLLSLECLRNQGNKLISLVYCLWING
jgi:malonate decarboxylase gamma subunit